MQLEEFLQCEYAELLHPRDLELSRKALSLSIDAAFATTQCLMGKGGTVLQADAHHLMQIIMLRSVTILQVAKGAGHHNIISPQVSLNLTQDPASAWGLVRSQFESVAVLGNLFSQHSREEQCFLHTLWVIAGLRTRQRLRGAMSDPRISARLPTGILQKADEELKIIDDLIEKLRSSPLFLGLTPKKQKEVDGAIEDCKYQFVFEGGVPRYAGWTSLFRRMVSSGAYDDIYPYLCSWGHPSYLSVLQFRGMFSDGQHIQAVQTATTFAAQLLAIALHEQMHIAPECINSFELLPEPCRFLLTFWNSALRTPTPARIHN